MSSYFLTDAQKAKMRADVLKMLPDTAVIQAGTVLSGTGGRWTEDYAPVTDGTVACRLDPMNSAGDRLGVDQSQETLDVQYQLTVPYDAPLNDNNRVVINGNTYEVLQLDRDHSWNVSRRAIVNEVR